MHKLRTAENLKKLIDSNDMNPTSAADEIGIAQSTVHRILTGEIKNPKTNQLLPICDYFSVSIDQLIGREELKDEEMKKPLNQNQKHLVELTEKLSPEEIRQLLAYGGGLAASKK